MELWDIRDQNGEITGRYVERGAPTNDGDYHLVVLAWIRNSKGEILLSKRSDKKFGAGMWESVGGAAVKGETSLQAVLREVKEEVGLAVTSDDAKFIKRKVFSEGHCWIADVWLFQTDKELSEFILQEEEVTEVKWVKIEDVERWIENNELFNSNVYFDGVKFLYE